MDSEPSHAAALRAALHTVGLDFTAREFREQFLGLADAEIVQRVEVAAGRRLTGEEQEQVARVKWEHLATRARTGGVVAYQATLKLMREAMAAGPVAICSGALRREIDLILDQLGVTVPIIVSADDTRRSKPDPAPYALAASRLGLEPGACVAIEDTSTGLRSAKGAGCMAVGVCHAMTPAELTVADLVVESTADLSVARLHGVVCGGGRGPGATGGTLRP